MNSIFAFLKRTQWAVWAFLAFVASLALLAVRSLFAGPRHVGPSVLPPAPAKLQAKVDKVEEEALKAKVTATVEATQAKKQLDEIALVSDGAERRKRLAAQLRKP